MTRPRGRPPLPPAAVRGIRVEVRVTADELAEIDRLREQDAAATETRADTRSGWLLWAAGIRR